jgi:hypothetical protein
LLYFKEFEYCTRCITNESTKDASECSIYHVVLALVHSLYELLVVLNALIKRNLPFLILCHLGIALSKEFHILVLA